MMKFKPILAPNDQPNLDDIKYPILASYKLDGIRCIFKNGEMLSRSLKPIVNKQLREKFKPIADYTKQYSLILDGEIYSHELTFQEITRAVMTQDFEDKKSIKKLMNNPDVRCVDENFKKFEKMLESEEEYDNYVNALLSNIKFYMFDGIYNNEPEESYKNRLKHIEKISVKFKNIVCVEQEEINSKEEIKVLFEVALNDGYEGLILRNPIGKYKFGRCTIREGNLYKVKPFRTFDAQIIEVSQGTKVNPDVPTTTNELGRTVTSKKKADRILVDMTRDFVVKYEGKILNVSTSSLTHDKRKELWKKKDELIGKWIEYKGMLVGAKDVPRHPVFIRFREPKEE